ncbi:CUBN [Mytilus coruscus]|uniref:CUBN n=1 Tax=Mytilus coruscus TaxID=42192 RepID=A0A6J8A105_MYTCO|nr:CUBN [Mytilus coruscus]
MILYLILAVMLRFQTYSSLPQLGKKVANLTEGPVKRCRQECQFDYIDIYNIDLSGFKVLMDRYCGESVPKEFISQQSKLEIVFNTDFTKTLHGFIGHYEFLDENWHQFGMSTIGCGPGFHTGMTGIITSPNYPDNPGISTEPGSRCTWIIKVQDNENILITMVDLDLSRKCHQFLCHETKHCLEKKNNGCKTPTYQYCINHSLLCNGLPNCGVTDNSDEARCLNRLVFIIIYVAVPVSAILLILVIALLCFRYRRRKQNVIKMESQKPPQTHWVSPHIRTSDPGSIAAQSATLLTTSFVSDDKNTTDFVDMTTDRRRKIQNRTIENIKSSEMFNKRKERDKNVHYEGVDVGSNNEDEIHDIVTHNIHLEPQMPNQGLRTHKKRSSYHMMQELNLENGPDPDAQLNV